MPPIGATTGHSRNSKDSPWQRCVVTVARPIEGKLAERDDVLQPRESVAAGSNTSALARSVQRLARLTGVRPVPSDRLRAPVPDWLADALVRDAGLTRLAVAAMDATTAFDTWKIHAKGSDAFQM